MKRKYIVVNTVYNGRKTARVIKPTHSGTISAEGRMKLRQHLQSTPVTAYTGGSL